MSGRLNFVPTAHLDAPIPDDQTIAQLRAILGLHLTREAGKTNVSRMPRRRTIVRRAAA
ncbi:hypothetical protein [Micromonospora vulcania]|uniref:Uncharacterized protein n=1 Tax=Micromonospora vulcania TaxID=1441873 RepID=A0ABW1HEI9_9ACTN